MTLLQRFSNDLLPEDDTKRIGIYLDANQWTDNGANITIVYNEAKNQVAYIEVSADFRASKQVDDL